MFTLKFELIYVWEAAEFCNLSWFSKLYFAKTNNLKIIIIVAV